MTYCRLIRREPYQRDLSNRRQHFFCGLRCSSRDSCTSPSKTLAYHQQKPFAIVRLLSAGTGKHHSSAGQLRCFAVPSSYNSRCGRSITCPECLMKGPIAGIILHWTVYKACTSFMQHILGRSRLHVAKASQCYCHNIEVPRPILQPGRYTRIITSRLILLFIKRQTPPSYEICSGLGCDIKQTSVCFGLLQT